VPTAELDRSCERRSTWRRIGSTRGLRRSRRDACSSWARIKSRSTKTAGRRHPGGDILRRLRLGRGPNGRSRARRPLPPTAPPLNRRDHRRFFTRRAAATAWPQPTLRSGYQPSAKETRRKEVRLRLSSGQVRSAMQMLDEVRAGRHVGEVLGYRFGARTAGGSPGSAGLTACASRFAICSPSSRARTESTRRRPPTT